MNAFNTREAEAAEWDEEDAHLRRRWGGLPAMIYVRISQADINAINRARQARTKAEKTEALHAKVRRHLAECREFAGRAGLDVRAEFTEENMSASALRPRRGAHDGEPGDLVPLPQRAALMGELNGLAGDMIVLTTEIARLYRAAEEASEMISAAKRLGRRAEPGRLVILDISERVYDLSTGGGRDAFEAAVGAAQAETRTLATRRRRKERDRAKAGHYLGRRPFGYDLDHDEAGAYTGLLTVREEEAALIRAAAGRLIAAAAGDPGRSPSCGAIAREWNAAGVTTTRGGTWSGGTVALLLRRPLYAGIRVHRPGDVDGRPPKDRPGRAYRAAWPPILDEATFDAVGRILDDPRRRLSLGDNRLQTPLAGLAYCGACGARLVSAPMRPGRHDRRLKCAAPGCGKVARAVGPVETWVRVTVRFWLGDGGAYQAAVAGLRAAGGQEQAAARVRELSARIAACEARIADAQAAAAEVGADMRDAMGIITRIRAEQHALASDRAAAERQAAALAAPAGGDVTGWPAGSPAEQRDWLRRYVAKVIIHPRRPGPPQRFDPAIVQVMPGAWWTGGGHPGYPPYTAPPAPPAGPPRLCELPGCDRVHDANGLCKLHNRRRWEAERAGHPGEWDRSPLAHRGRPAPGTPPRLCDLPGCGRPHEGRGLCNGHALRRNAAERAGHPEEWDRSPDPAPGGARDRHAIPRRGGIAGEPGTSRAAPRLP